MERDNSVVTDFFDGQLMNKIECLKCGHKSLAFDNFMDLSLSIPRGNRMITGTVSVQDCIKAFIKDEEMAETGYKCGKCKSGSSLVKGMSIYRLPNVLCLHLKRFYNSSIRREKLNTTVDIPLMLDMAPYAPRSSKSLYITLVEHESIKRSKYQLVGISHHSGTLYGGHYIG